MFSRNFYLSCSGNVNIQPHLSHHAHLVHLQHVSLVVLYKFILCKVLWFSMSVWLSLCVLACLQNHMSKLCELFSTYYLWQWISPPLTTVQYVTCGACLDHLTKWSMIVTSSTADQWSRSKAPPRSSYLSRPLCWQCDTSVDGRSPGLAEDGKKGVLTVFLQLTITVTEIKNNWKKIIS